MTWNVREQTAGATPLCGLSHVESDTVQTDHVLSYFTVAFALVLTDTYVHQSLHQHKASNSADQCSVKMQGERSPVNASWGLVSIYCHCVHRHGDSDGHLAMSLSL